MSSKAIATQMRDFASNPASHSMLVEDPTMLKTLVSFMDAADTELTLLCLETFLEISKPDTHRKFLLALPGLLAKLATFSDRDGSTDEDKKIRAVAKQTFDNLQTIITTRTTVAPVALKASAFGTRSGYLHHVSVRIPEVSSDAARAKAEAALIATKGVVSVTFDSANKVATIYCSLKPSEMEPRLLASLQYVGYKAELYSLDDKENKSNGSSSSSSSSSSSASGATKAADGRPGYITKGDVKKDALVRYVDKNSLQSRFDKSKPQAKDKEAAAASSGGFFSGLKSYFW